jgi:hypothetical protein
VLWKADNTMMMMSQSNKNQQNDQNGAYVNLSLPYSSYIHLNCIATMYSRKLHGSNTVQVYIQSLS